MADNPYPGINARLLALADRLSDCDDAKLLREAADHIDGLRSIVGEARSVFGSLKDVCDGATYNLVMAYTRLDTPKRKQ